MISHKHRCIFTHVPKTAGKSILASFGLPLLAKQYNNGLDYIEEPYGHKPLWQHAHAPAFKYFKFAFVRNPWDRLVSAFFYLDAGGCNEIDAAYRDTKLAHYNGNYEAFVLDLESHLKALHFRPQTHWLCEPRGTPLTDFVGRYERLQADFTTIADRLALPNAPPVTNASEHDHYRKYYNSATRAVVAHIYREDIAAFGYEY